MSIMSISHTIPFILNEELENLARDPASISRLNEELLNNHDFVKLAIKINTAVLKYLSHDHPIKNDKKFVIETLRSQAELSEEFISTHLRTDYDFMLDLIDEFSIEYFTYADPILQNDDNFIFDAAVRNPFVLRLDILEEYNLDEELILLLLETPSARKQLVEEDYNLPDDLEFVLNIIRKHPSALQFASPEFQDNPIVVSAAIELDGSLLQYASERLQNHPTFQAIAEANLPAQAIETLDLEVIEADIDMEDSDI